MSQSPTFDVSIERLRRIGGGKWSQYPDKIGAFVAEMDFGTAAPIAEAMHEAIDLGLLGYLPEHLATRMAEAWGGFARRRYGWEVPPERVRPLAVVMSSFQAAVENFSASLPPVLLT